MDALFQLAFYSLVLVGTIVLHKILIPMSQKLELVDVPGGRKSHDGKVPLIGGVAMFFGFCVSGVILTHGNEYFLLLIVALVIILTTGILDDLNELGVKTRFAAQTAASLVMMIFGGVSLHSMGNLVGLGEITLGVMALPVTVFCVVGVINALNMADGVDGLAGGVSLVTFMGFYVLSLLGGDGLFKSGILLLYISVIAAFLYFNMRGPGQPRARVFMGDAGSMFLGFSIAWFSIDLSQGDHQVLRPVTALWVFSVPLFDTCRVMARRVKFGRSPFTAGRDHIHHILLDHGVSISRVVFLIVGGHFALVAFGVAGEVADIPEYIMFPLFILAFITYSLAVNSLDNKRANQSA
ncbi:undecaprenyl/decaprenyl-phosphate alpha-N-acetylglucosaminyl 1-phosphate transferase [Hahella sp. CR1]|uniref:MraY family glycosyltransferase n=1 Tax=Hahella sp. CR1 TaxID=2992807 RepID=UPI0024426AD4|nr:MraY family glycosyltransferase [Hahella sp. CR1]MDG9667327.1 undecaprenyl/decaprenyl-phosphate alpha-N-acetylglucosaminyl 1-phosphate transferase [Hahella sp. CR1]